MSTQTYRSQSTNQSLAAVFAGRSTPFAKTQSIRASLTDTTQTKHSTREAVFALSSTGLPARIFNQRAHNGETHVSGKFS
jgi:hypothetical protein